MFEIFKFECQYQLRSPLFLVLAGVFFLLAFLIMGSESVSLGGIGNNLNLNASWVIVFTQFFFSTIGMLAAISISAQAITRDLELRTAEMIYASGIAPTQFLLGRFFAGTLFGVLVGTAAILGTLLASVMPWLDQERVGPFSLAPFVYSFFVVTLPNLFFTSALFYSVAALTRSMLAAFVAAVAFLVAYIVVSAFSDPDLIQVYAIADPFGSTAFGEVSRYWTVFERNTQLVPVEGNLLWNRLLWVTVGVLALAFTVWRYRFNLDPSPFRRKRAVSITETAPITARVEVEPRFESATRWAQLRSQLRTDIGGVVKSVPFYALLGFGALNVWGGFQGATSAFGTPTLPTTSALLRAIGSNYLFFILLIIIYFAGEIVHRERQTKVAEVVDSMPFPNVIMVLSKIGALWFIVTALLVFGMLAAMLTQVFGEYYHIELGLYLKSVFFVQGGFFYLLAILAVFVQVMAGNKWLGMVALLLVFFLFQTLPSVGFEHGLYNFGTPNAPHSDMNGYGHYWVPVVAFTIYWAFFCVLLIVASHLFQQRGLTQGFTDRWQLAGARAHRGIAALSLLALFAFTGTGAWIFYNTNVLNTYRIQDEVELLQSDYEKAYKSFELMPLPEVIAVDSRVDLYPEKRHLESSGRAVLLNTHDEPLDKFLLSSHPFAQVEVLEVRGAREIETEAQYGAHMVQMAKPLASGAKTELTWQITWRHLGMNNGNESSVTNGASNRVVANGTFVNNTEIMPIVGYNTGLELGDPNKRREYDLEPIVRLPKLGDPQWLNRSQLGLSRRTAFRTEFSTSADQIAIAPGYLVGDVVEREGRRIYTYEMDEPIWPFFSFVSARYDVVRDRWEGGETADTADAGSAVDIEIYYHPEHDYNIESMINGTKKSLDYFSRAFSPYQYRQFRILEFPRYASFAQSFPNTIPYSEAIGFVADLREEDRVDLVFYVTAHEMAHQWWGHQVAGAYMQGMTVIVETLAQYSALMVMRKEYGPDRMRRFLRAELDRYLTSRGGELIEELPLVKNENQQYIHYQKGSLVMYALADLIGEDNVNLALRNFLAKSAYGSGPFPTAADLVDEFRAVADASHQSTIDDWFDHITLYDFAVEAAQAKEVDDGWEVQLQTRAAKYYADGEGRERAAPVGAWVDIGVFPDTEEELDDYELPQPLHFERVYVDDTQAQFVITVSEKPHRVGIDPYNKLIDRNPEDNLRLVD